MPIPNAKSQKIYWKHFIAVQTHETSIYRDTKDYLCAISKNFGEEDFQKFASNFLCSNCLWLLLRRQYGWHHHLNKLELHIFKDYLCVISKNSVQ